jgi:hypothetical protein
MDVSRTLQIAVVALSLVPSTLAQASRSRYDPSGQRPASKPQDGLVDFTLKRINPTDTDYGQCLGEGRSILLDETVKNGYFWSNLTALGLLGCLFIIIIYQHCIQIKREWTTSEILAQYEQALTRSNGQIEEATNKNRSLAESLAELKQSALRPQSCPTDTVESVPCRPMRSHTASTQLRATTAPRGNGAKPTMDGPAAVAVPASGGSQIALFKPGVELVTKVNVLEQQLGRCHELEKQLRRQLNETGRKLQTEQEKNRSLKGE